MADILIFLEGGSVSSSVSCPCIDGNDLLRLKLNTETSSFVGHSRHQDQRDNGGFL